MTLQEKRQSTATNTEMNQMLESSEKDLKATIKIMSIKNESTRFSAKKSKL